MKNSKKTLLILTPGFPANEMDSTCLPAQQALVRCMNELFPLVNITILAFQYPYTPISYKWRGNRVIPFNGRNRNRLARWLVWWEVWRRLKKIHQEETVIGILSFWLDECALVGHYFGKKNSLPHFTWLLGQDARPGNRYAKLIPLHAEFLVAISDLLAKKFYENYGVRPMHVITNGIETGLYQTRNMVRDIDIIGVGSLIPLKRYGLFIEVIKEIQTEIPELKVLICGKGPEQNHLLNLVKENGLSHTIEIAGEKKHEEVLELMQRSKLLLHTSSYEGFSGACLEALYAGAHVVSFFSPQDGWIRHWHIVDDTKAMIDISLSLLRSPSPDHSPVLPYEMKNTAAQMMQLFTG